MTKVKQLEQDVMVHSFEYVFLFACLYYLYFLLQTLMSVLSAQMAVHITAIIQ